MYKLQPNYSGTEEAKEAIQRLSDNAFIPRDPGNSDYQKYLEWVAEGNTPEAAVDPEDIPAE